ncbi:MAG: hypothetical protein GAK30_01342 [Paracidovorax wautersii]|uniref:Alkylhydroperoxidase AhpD family core domain-containing protein n=1 Tax=Paracidovorax wautersii TaxID=1177982 RepID=A0A7V8FQ44_9BURK|nr:MAG: hypothetical protein GAK30_01342 [Paracidovorax wautersii]
MAAVTHPSIATQPTLHYIYDPFCGWCYAAAPLLKVAAELPGLAVRLHAGGMLAGAARKTLTPQWREYVMPHDHRIAKMTGQLFGAAYFDGLLRRNGAVLDSEAPIAAILAAESLGGHGLRLLHALQHGHYVDGQIMSDPVAQRAAAREIGLDEQAFTAALATTEGEATRRHIAASRQLLAAVGGHGFPTFALELAGDDGLPRRQAIDFGAFLGQPDAWRKALAEVVQTAQPGSSTDAAPVGRRDSPAKLAHSSTNLGRWGRTAAAGVAKNGASALAPLAMSRLPLLHADNAPDASRPFIEKVRAANGFVPNLIAALANSPQALETYLSVGALNARGSLGLAEREVVQLTAARIHGCGFCVAGHSATVLKNQILSRAETLALHRGDPLPDDRLQALAAFTAEVIATRGAVGDGALAALLAAGYTHRQALDVVLGVSLATLCNFANNLAQTELNPQLQPYAVGSLEAGA